MTKATVTEYAGLMPSPVGGQGQIPLQPPLAEQQVDYTAGHAESAAFNAKTLLVRIEVDSIAAYTFGAAPVANTTGSARLVAGQTEYHGVPPGLGHKVSFITTT
jgi:hypothetical protein